MTIMQHWMSQVRNKHIVGDVDSLVKCGFVYESVIELQGEGSLLVSIHS